MKKNVIFRIAAVVLMCALVTACFASSTFAKYTSGASADETLTVAKWLVNVNDKDIYDEESFDLTHTIYDTVDGEGTDTTTLIAPGTKGSFTVEVENASDVDATIDLSLDTDALPEGLADKLTFEDDADTKIVNGVLAAGKSATVTYSWVWAYYTNDDEDATDTNIGHAATDDGYEIIVSITATQVD